MAKYTVSLKGKTETMLEVVLQPRPRFLYDFTRRCEHQFKGQLADNGFPRECGKSPATLVMPDMRQPGLMQFCADHIEEWHTPHPNLVPQRGRKRSTPLVVVQLAPGVPPCHVCGLPSIPGLRVCQEHEYHPMLEGAPPDHINCRCKP